MRARVEQVGGTLTLTGPPAGGTFLEVAIPRRPTRPADQPDQPDQPDQGA
ncbi:hypothetical protein ACFQX6_30820 [Streptosporangium lutulentum]